MAIPNKKVLPGSSRVNSCFYLFHLYLCSFVFFGGGGATGGRDTRHPPNSRSRADPDFRTFPPQPPLHATPTHMGTLVVRALGTCAPFIRHAVQLVWDTATQYTPLRTVVVVEGPDAVDSMMHFQFSGGSPQEAATMRGVIHGMASAVLAAVPELGAHHADLVPTCQPDLWWSGGYDLTTQCTRALKEHPGWENAIGAAARTFLRTAQVPCNVVWVRSKRHDRMVEVAVEGGQAGTLCTAGLTWDDSLQTVTRRGSNASKCPDMDSGAGTPTWATTGGRLAFVQQA